jgi:hypothetical protein
VSKKLGIKENLTLLAREAIEQGAFFNLKVGSNLYERSPGS